MDDKEKLARKRFMLLNVMRIVAVAQVMLGVAFLSPKSMFEVPEIVGYALMIIGAAEFFWLPIVLKRSWQKQDGEGG